MIRLYSLREVDELIFLDVKANTKEKLEKHFPDKSITWDGFAYDDFGLTPMAASYVAPTPDIH